MIKKILSVLTILITLTVFLGCPSPITPNPEDTEEEKFTITYNGNGNDSGIAPVDANKYTTNKVITILSSNNLDKIGYTFTGWNTLSNGKGTAYTDGSEITMGTANIELYAQWTINGYNVTFNANTGSGNMAILTANYNETKNLTANTFTKTGYTFTGWNTLSDGNGTAYADGSEITIDTENISLFAQWTINSYNLTFNANTGSGNMAILTANYNETKNLTANTFTKTGYTFTGWNTLSDGNGTAYADGSEITMGTANIELYAQWTINGYNVTFNANTGSGNMAILTANYNETKNLTANTFTKIGYTFTGWSTLSDGNGTAYADGSEITIDTENISLFAQWTINSYNLTFNANTGSGNMAVLSLNYNESKTLTSNTFTKTGYTFSGWNTLSDGNGTAYADGSEITMGTAKIELFALWTVNTYTLTYNLNEGTNAEANPAEYTIESAEITLADPERTSYRFDGWYDNALFSGSAITSIPTGSTGNHAFWAKWTPKQAIEVSVPVTEEGTITFDCPVTIAVGDSYIFSIEEEDYTFYKWMVDGNEGVFGNNITVSEDTGNYDFDAARLYTITVIVKDAEGKTFSDYFSLRVTN